MDSTRLFYKICSVNESGKPQAFLGTAFPVGPNGWLMTCRHVVDVELPPGARLAVFDNELNVFSVLTDAPILSKRPNTDMALLPNALGRRKAEFFPILNPTTLTVGANVYSYGFFSIGGKLENVEPGYFSGSIVNFFQHADASKAMFTLPYAVVEGLSGSPVLTYHNGPKVVGIATGNRTTRILAAEIFEYKDEKLEFKETINRIVEFGTAMHCAAIAQFLISIPGCNAIISDDRCAITGLE